MLDRVDQILKVLGDKKRLRILKLLEKRPMCVCELTFVLAVTQPSVSRHLRKLCSAGLINCRKTGLWTDYFLAASHFQQQKFLKGLFSQLEEDRLIKQDRAAAAKIDRTELCGCRP